MKTTFQITCHSSYGLKARREDGSFMHGSYWDGAYMGFQERVDYYNNYNNNNNSNNKNKNNNDDDDDDDDEDDR